MPVSGFVWPTSVGNTDEMVCGISLEYDVLSQQPQREAWVGERAEGHPAWRRAVEVK